MSARTWHLIKAFALHGVLGGWLFWTLFGVVLGQSVNIFLWIVVSYTVYLIWNVVAELLENGERLSESARGDAEDST